MAKSFVERSLCSEISYRPPMRRSLNLEFNEVFSKGDHFHFYQSGILVCKIPKAYFKKEQSQFFEGIAVPV